MCLFHYRRPSLLEGVSANSSLDMVGGPNLVPAICFVHDTKLIVYHRLVLLMWVLLMWTRKQFFG